MKVLNVFMSLLVVAILAQSCGKGKADESSKTNGMNVQTEVVTKSTVAKKYHFTGAMASVNQSTLSTRLMGQISKVHVGEGDVVNKGQLLISIRSNDILAKKKQVEANIIQAKAANKHAADDHKRLLVLFESKSATQKELDDITVHYEMTKAQLEMAQKAKEEVLEMLSYANIVAPYSGVITQKFVDAGDMANPGMPLLAIEAPDLFEVNVKIPESEVYMVEKGDTVEVRVGTLTQPVPGMVARVSPSSRFSGSQFDAVITLLPMPGQVEKLRSGMFAHVDLLKGKEEKILVEEKQLVTQGQLQGIWIVSQNNQALLRWVRLGKKYGDKIEVLSGLNEGSKLVVKADGRLYDGAELNLN
ncbi:efflux RND transporter periplasmic adaptor subunit [Carboxylicivirga sp. N1Y90]|uniref:efflux RND transporter periplasmic adaptor subunit n=1 Tax=Carboxylicivirga fragile TaxID=3417571 RepID=UPI003D35186B|nr:efflux RND transporter periplasmic adaptor subunit [Marinilabiliaceae bacterium N1Y90]